MRPARGQSNAPSLAPAIVGLRWDGLRLRIRDLFRDRKGVASLVMTVSAIAIIGLAGLATEGGTWDLEKRHGQNTADAAAVAGVLALTQGNSAVTAGTRVATLNNYVAGTTSGTTTTVAVTTGTYSAPTFTPTAVSPNAVRAVVTRSPPRLFSTLFLARSPSIGE